MASCDISKKARVQRQIIRGVLGGICLGVAAYFFKSNPSLSFLAVLLSLIPLRGCPVCWTVNMYEALAHYKAEKRKSAEDKNPETPPETASKTRPAA